MSELRQDLASERWVIIATERAKRPHEFRRNHTQLTGSLAAWDADCPFCPGNEELDLEVWQMPARGPWQVRIVRNRYPALRPNGHATYLTAPPFHSMGGVGYHEIVVESPRHNTCHALESAEDVTQIMRAFRTRGRELSDDPSVEQITYFKNHGEQAGTSLLHPHAQLIALPVIPHNHRHLLAVAARHYAATGRCVTCEMLAAEREDGRRIYAENEHFVAFIPFAAASPFQTWIVPRRHNGSFLHVEDHELDALGAIVHATLRTLYVGLVDPDYNYVIQSAPVRELREENHWYLSIVPRVTRAAGFELGTEMYINPVQPEEAAAFLRSVYNLG